MLRVVAPKLFVFAHMRCMFTCRSSRDQSTFFALPSFPYSKSDCVVGSYMSRVPGVSMHFCVHSWMHSPFLFCGLCANGATASGLACHCNMT